MAAGDGARGAFRLEPLARTHDRSGFACGVDSLDIYLKTQASQDALRMANAVFVLVEPAAPATIIGYFTLCAFAVATGAVPEAARRHLPRYPLVSATLIGRLAVSRSRHGDGIGGTLLGRALKLAHDNAAIVGSSMVVVNAIDQRAMDFYAAHGFIRGDDSMRLFLPMATIATLAGG